MRLRDYQRNAVNWLLGRPHGALFADPGTGKTLIMLTLLRRLELLRTKPLRVLLVAPIRVMYNVWPAEIEKWGFDISWSILHGPRKAEALQQPLPVETPSIHIDLLNPEGLKWFDEQPRPHYDVFVLDESSLFRNPTSVRMKILREILPAFERRYILTGTPTPNGMHDLWSQMFIVDLGATLGTRITHYRNAYFYHEQHNDIHKYRLIPGMDEVIKKRTAPSCFRIDAENCLDLPPLLVNNIRVGLPREARRMYDSMEKNLFAELTDGKRFAPTAGSAYGLCCQLAGGAVYHEDGPGHDVVHDAKIRALKELRAELGDKPLLVVFRYRHEAERLQASTRAYFPLVMGGTGERTTSQLIKQWNNGELPLLGAQYQSISHGLNLQGGGNDIVWFSLADDFDVYEQLNRRIYRSGVRDTVRVHRLLADRTVDWAIARRLDEKRTDQQGLFDALEEYRRAVQEGPKG